MVSKPSRVQVQPAKEVHEAVYGAVSGDMAMISGETTTGLKLFFEFGTVQLNNFLIFLD